MQYTEPMTTVGRKQMRIRQEIKLKTVLFQTTTYKDKNHPSISASPIQFPEHQHWSPLNTNIN